MLTRAIVLEVRTMVRGCEDVEELELLKDELLDLVDMVDERVFEVEQEPDEDEE